MNLTYRIERLLFGERGIVVKCEPVEVDFGSKNVPFFLKDDNGKLPSVVTFVNPLGEVKQILTEREYSIIQYGVKEKEILIYKDYSKGDQYPSL